MLGEAIVPPLTYSYGRNMTRESTRVSVYTLRIMGPHWMEFPSTAKFDEANQKVLDNIGEALSHAEDAVNDALPEGYYCKIEGWQ